MRPEINNERAEREWLYIIERVGEKKAMKAMEKLGNRRAFPLNVSKILGITLPEEEHLPKLPVSDEDKKRSFESGKQAISDIRKILKHNAISN